MRERAVVILAAIFVVVASACTATARVSVGANGETNGYSFSPTVDRTGRFVAFESDATNLVTGDTNGVEDVFVRDTRNQFTSLVSRATSGALGNGSSTRSAIGGDGRNVLFTS